jgi:hypothetical protein
VHGAHFDVDEALLAGLRTGLRGIEIRAPRFVVQRTKRSSIGVNSCFRDSKSSRWVLKTTGTFRYTGGMTGSSI